MSSSEPPPPAESTPAAEPANTPAVQTVAPERPLIEAVDEPMSPAAAKKRQRSLFIIQLVAVGMVVAIGLFWWQTWFGAKLSDADMAEYLTAAVEIRDKANPEYNKSTRNALHALNDLSRRLWEKTPGVEKFFPALARLADHPEPVIRRTAAWVMGDAPGHPLLLEPLIQLVNDPDPLVQQNAACSLSKYKDGEHSRPVLTAMLRPFAVPAPVAGKVEQMIDKDTHLREAMQICVLESIDNKRVSVTAPFKGQAMDVQAHVGDTVGMGQTLCLIKPTPEQVLAALTALSLIGRAEDLNLIQSYTQAGNGDMIRDRAQDAIEKIEARASAPVRNTGGAPE